MEMAEQAVVVDEDALGAIDSRAGCRKVEGQELAEVGLYGGFPRRVVVVAGRVLADLDEWPRQKVALPALRQIKRAARRLNSTGPRQKPLK
jgi:hypothetical protein